MIVIISNDILKMFKWFGFTSEEMKNENNCCTIKIENEKLQNKTMFFVTPRWCQRRR